MMSRSAQLENVLNSIMDLCKNSSLANTIDSENAKIDKFHFLRLKGQRLQASEPAGLGRWLRLPTFCCGGALSWWSPHLFHPIFGHFIRPCTAAGAAAETVYCMYAASSSYLTQFPCCQSDLCLFRHSTSHCEL